MIITRISIKNYKSIEEADIDLSNKDLIGVIGEYDDNPDQSNGAGKSTFLESILFAFYKYDPRSNTAFVGKYADYCEVSLTAKKNDKLYVFKRYLSMSGDHKLTCIADGAEIKGGIKAVQNKINSIIGIPKPTLMTYVNFFTRNADKILSETPAKRVEILTKDLLDATRYKKYRKEVYDIKNKMLAKIEIGITDIKTLEDSKAKTEEQLKEGKEASLNMEIVTLRESIKKLSIKEKEYTDLIEKASSSQQISEQLNIFQKQESIANQGIQTNKQSLNEYIQQRTQVQKDIKQIITDIDTLNSTIATLSGESNPLVAATMDLKAPCQKFETVIKNLAKQETEIQDSQNEVRAEIKKLEDRDKGLRDMDSECPICTSELEKTVKAKLAKDTQNSLAALQAEYDQVSAENTQIVTNRQNMEDRYTQYNTATSTRTEKIKEKEKNETNLPIIDDQIKKLSEAVTAGESSLNEIITQIKELEAQHKVSTDIDTDEMIKKQEEAIKLIEENQASVDEKKEQLYDIKNLKENMQKIEVAIKEQKRKTTEMQEKSKSYNILYDAFGSGGVQTLLIEEVMKYVEIDTNEVLNKIDPTKEIKVIMKKIDAQGEETERTIDFQINNLVFNESMSYNDYSDGEKIYINFALRLALSKYLTEQASPIQFVVLDELVGNLDKVNKIHILKILYFLKDYFRQIFFTSHDDITKQFPYLVKVLKERKTGKAKAFIYTNPETSNDLYKKLMEE